LSRNVTTPVDSSAPFESEPVEIIVVHEEYVHAFPSIEAKPMSPALGDALVVKDADANSAHPTRVDDRQEELMSVLSTDGRPPNRVKLQSAWRWFALGAAVLAVGALAVAIMKGASGSTLIVGFIGVVAVLIAAAPVWGAGVLRGSEERAARKQALIQEALTADRSKSRIAAGERASPMSQTSPVGRNTAR